MAYNNKISKPVRNVSLEQNCVHVTQELKEKPDVFNDSDEKMKDRHIKESYGEQLRF